MKRTEFQIGTKGHNFNGDSGMEGCPEMRRSFLEGSCIKGNPSGDLGFRDSGVGFPEIGGPCAVRPFNKDYHILRHSTTPPSRTKLHARGTW